MEILIEEKSGKISYSFPELSAELSEEIIDSIDGFRSALVEFGENLCGELSDRVAGKRVIGIKIHKITFTMILKKEKSED